MTTINTNIHTTTMATEFKEEYDDHGVLCRYTDETGWIPIEEHCEECGYKTCECDDDEEEECGDGEECENCFNPECFNSYQQLKVRYLDDYAELLAMKKCETTTLAAWNKKVSEMEGKYQRLMLGTTIRVPEHILANK